MIKVRADVSLVRVVIAGENNIFTYTNPHIGNSSDRKMKKVACVRHQGGVMVVTALNRGEWEITTFQGFGESKDENSYEMGYGEYGKVTYYHWYKTPCPLEVCACVPVP